MRKVAKKTALYKKTAELFDVNTYRISNEISKTENGDKMNDKEISIENNTKTGREENGTPDMSALKLDKRFETVIYLVRHGQSLGNAKREFLGHTDKDLSELGYLQAARTAEFLAYERIDAVYSSSLIRAHNTSLPHAKMRNMPVIDSDELKEIYAGAWEGLFVEDIISKYPHEFIDEWRNNFGLSRIPEGEYVPDLAKRIYNEIYRIAKENEGRHILIGCHAAAIRSFWGVIAGIRPENLAAELPFPENASVSVVYFDGERLIPGEYSHAAHLLDLL